MKEEWKLLQDQTAALRCVRLARMAANECLSLGLPWDGEVAAQCRANIRAARWQACSAVALNQDHP